jgi:hypothetical protein
MIFDRVKRITPQPLTAEILAHKNRSICLQTLGKVVLWGARVGARIGRCARGWPMTESLLSSFFQPCFHFTPDVLKMAEKSRITELQRQEAEMAQVEKQGNDPRFPLGPVLAAVSAIWVGVGTLTAGGDTWVPVPLIGYFRYDIAALLLSVEGILMLQLVRRRYVMLLLLAVLAIVPSILPEGSRPEIYLSPPPKSFRDRVYARKAGNITVHDNGISLEESSRLLKMVQSAQSRPQWTHISMALGLPYFIFGNSVHFDRKKDEKDIPT